MTYINWSNVTDFGGVLQSANTATAGSFWTMCLFLIWIVAFLVTIYWGWEVALMMSSFIGIAFGIMFVYANLVAWQFLLVFFAMIIVAYFYSTGSRGVR